MHDCTHRRPCLGQQGAQALLMSGTHERVAPHEKTNFASGAVVSRLTSEPLSGRIVPPDGSPLTTRHSTRLSATANQDPASSAPLGKLRPPKGDLRIWCEAMFRLQWKNVALRLLLKSNEEADDLR